MINLNALNPEQRQAVETIRGPVLILAGAGTGKTRVITFRIAHMVSQGIPPGRILGVTFTNKAAREMLERVQKLIPRPKKSVEDEPADRPTICTFHSLCVRILRQHIDRLGYKRNFVIYDESDQIGAIKKILSRFSGDGSKVDPRAVLSLLSRYRNGSAQAAFEDVNTAAMAQHVRSLYESALHACNAVDFDDLILLTLRLFKEHPDALEACRTRFQFVMVDEYQDTNAAQFQLVNELTKAHRNLCVVGDDDQSIYGWRGAEIANLLDLEKHYPEVKIVKLEQNYRSTNTILKAANTLIRHNARRRPKQLWSQKGAGAKISLSIFPDDEAEARGTVEQIEFRRQIKRIPWSDQAILFRTNIQSRPLETALRQAAVRYNLIGGQSFFDRREIRDTVAYLKVMVNPHDDVSLLRIANTPARGLSETTMERLLAASHERKGSVFSAMKNPTVLASLPTKTRLALEGFVHWLERTRQPLQRAEALRLQPWADQFLAETGYIDDLRRSEKNPETAENRIQNVSDLVATLDKAAPAGKCPAECLEEALDQLTLDSEWAEKQQAAGDAVTLITMHSCKGLEFPHVYIVGLEDGLLPHSRSKTEGTLDEERRLFYVALTRAMQTLTLCHCETRKKYGASVPCHVSPFLAELPQDLIESADDRPPISVADGKDLFASLRNTLGA